MASTRMIMITAEIRFFVFLLFILNIITPIRLLTDKTTLKL